MKLIKLFIVDVPLPRGSVQLLFVIPIVKAMCNPAGRCVDVDIVTWLFTLTPHFL